MGKRKEGEIKRLKKFLKEEGKDKRGMENLEKELGGEKITRRAKKGVLARVAGFVYGTALALSLWGCAPSSYQTQSAYEKTPPRKTDHSVRPGDICPLFIYFKT